MTLTDLRALAHYHRTEASSLDNDIRLIELTIVPDSTLAAHIMTMRNRLFFHQKAANDLSALADAFETFGGLAASPVTGT